MTNEERQRLDALEQTNGTHWRKPAKPEPEPRADGDESIHERAERLEREARTDAAPKPAARSVYRIDRGGRIDAEGNSIP